MFTKNNIVIDFEAKEKIDIINKIAEKALELEIITDRQGLIKDLLKREEESCTGIHKGIAIPHAKSSYVNKPAIIFIKTKEAIEWESMDEVPINIFFALLASDKDTNNTHLMLLSKIATELLEENFIEKITTISEIDKAYEIINNILRKDEN